MKIQRRHLLLLTLFVLFGSTYFIYFLLQQNNEMEIKQSLLLEQTQDQEQAVKFIAQNTESDMKLILATLNGLAKSAVVQESLTSNQTIPSMSTTTVKTLV